MKRKLACADFTFPLLEHEKSLDLIRLLDFEAVDIGLFEERSHLWPSREFQDTQASAKALRQKLSDRGLEAADIFLQTASDFAAYALNHPEPARRQKARDWFGHTLDYAAACGAPHVTLLPGVHFEQESEQDSLARCQEELAWRVEKAQAQSLTFSVEAHVGSIVPEPEPALALVEAVPGLTLTLDYTHFTRVGIPDSRVEPMLAHASHFHVRGAKRDRLQASFKDNTIDYARVLEVMDQIGYDGYVGVEYVYIDWEHANENDNVSETVQFRDFLRQRMK